MTTAPRARHVGIQDRNSAKETQATVVQTEGVVHEQRKRDSGNGNRTLKVLFSTETALNEIDPRKSSKICVHV